MFEIFIALYVVITIFAIVMSYNEQRRTGNKSFLFNALSFVACVIWPATIAIIFIAAQRQKA